MSVYIISGGPSSDWTRYADVDTIKVYTLYLNVPARLRQFFEEPNLGKKTFETAITLLNRDRISDDNNYFI